MKFRAGLWILTSQINLQLIKNHLLDGSPARFRYCLLGLGISFTSFFLLLTFCVCFLHLSQMQRDPSDSSQHFKQLTTQIVPDINIYIVKSKCFQNSKLQCIWKLSWIRYTFRNREFLKNHLSTTTKHTKKSPKSNFYHQALSQSLLSQWILGRVILKWGPPPFHNISL